jgi:glycosyltransferase involved in cell wall biosynthesis
VRSSGEGILDAVDSTQPNILLVTSSLDIGGTELQLTALASELKRRGQRVAVFSLADGPLTKTLKSQGVPTIVALARLGRGRGFATRLLFTAISAAKLLGVLISRRPTVVHFFLPEAYLVGAPLTAFVRTPVRVMSRRSRNVYQQHYPRLVMQIERRLHRLMTAILGNSNSVVLQLHNCEGVAADRLGLIYNGLDMSRFETGAERISVREATRAALNLSPTVLMLVMVANLIAYKGHLDLLEALATISGRLPHGWRLVLVGRDEGIEVGLRARARALAIDENVIFVGSRSDVSKILMAGDIGILCSHQEGFSNAVLEGMGAGLPMVVTDVGGNTEAVVDGESGLVVPPHNPRRLAEAILRLADDATLRSTLGLAARGRVATCFSLQQCVANYDALYRLLLRGGVPGDLPQLRGAL